MALTKYRLGDLIELSEQVNSDLEYGADSVMGMTITKQIIPTKADTKNADLSKYLIVYPNEFIYNPRTHGKKIGLGFNNTDKAFLISWNNIAYRIKDSAKRIISPEYLFMHFNRDEWDRAACYHSWGSSTEVFSWDALCDMEFDLPPIEIQQKYVDIYNAMLANQKAYEQGLDDLKLTCDAFIENLRRSAERHEIGAFIRPYKEKNTDGAIKLEQGININKEFITPQRSNSNLFGRQIVRTGQFAYCTQLNNENVAIAYRTGPDCVVSSVYDVFEIVNESVLIPEYLMLWLTRKEFGRFVYWASQGSAYEFLSYDNLCSVRIPVPNIETQKSIANVYKSLTKRKAINEKLKLQIKDICPILIKGSLEEARNS